MMRRDDITMVRESFDAAIKASMPHHVMTTYLNNLDIDPTAILAIGKASGPMAQACRDNGMMAKGMIITHDASVAVPGFEIFVGGHPVPNQNSLSAAEAALNFVSSLTDEDHLLVLLSGGGSALMAMPQDGLTLDDKMLINQALLNSGVDIHHMNMVRRLMSQVKGGRLARAASPAKVTQWVMSDVPATGNLEHDLSAIASGPFVGDPTAWDEAIAVIKKAGLDENPNISTLIQAISADASLGPVRLGDPQLAGVETKIIASNTIARKAAEKALMIEDQKCPLSDLTGEAAIMGATIANFVMAQNKSVTAVTGGETVVTIPSDIAAGKGGRSQELALSFLVTMSEHVDAGFDIPSFTLLAAGTDGRDGPTDAAGALVTDRMIARGGYLSQMRDALKRHDSYNQLQACDALIKIPPTGTNLADLVILKTGAI